jgi:hypothetical protein
VISEISIFGDKAVIKQNKFGVWQFRMWISSEKKYVEKVNNYELGKQVGIEVEQHTTEEEWDVAYKRRVVYVAVGRKKKVAEDAIKSVVIGVFPS